MGLSRNVSFFHILTGKYANIFYLCVSNYSFIFIERPVKIFGFFRLKIVFEIYSSSKIASDFNVQK